MKVGRRKHYPLTYLVVEMTFTLNPNDLLLDIRKWVSIVESSAGRFLPGGNVGIYFLCNASACLDICCTNGTNMKWGMVLSYQVVGPAAVGPIGF